MKGDYIDTNAGAIHKESIIHSNEAYTDRYHEVHSGQVKLNVEFNPEEKTKTYNLQKKSGDYIIGEVGKIDVNNGQTLEVI